MAKNAILVAIDGTQAEGWIPRLKERAKGRDLRIWPDAVGDQADIAYAFVWRPPQGLTHHHFVPGHQPQISQDRKSIRLASLFSSFPCPVPGHLHAFIWPSAG